MNIYEIEVLAIGEYVAIDPYDHSGCSDKSFDCWQEATFTVAAESIGDAVKMIYKDYERFNRDWTNSCDILYFNPDVILDGEDAGEPEVVDYHFFEPRKGNWITDAPAKYSEACEKREEDKRGCCPMKEIDF